MTLIQTWGNGVNKDCDTCKYSQNTTGPEQTFGYYGALKCMRTIYIVHDSITGHDFEQGAKRCDVERAPDRWYRLGSNRCGIEGKYWEPI